MSKRNRIRLVFIIVTIAIANTSFGDNEFYNDGNLILVASDGLVELPTSIYHNGSFVGDYDLVQAHNKIDGANSWPLVFVDLATIGYTRGTYQTETGSAILATSVVATPWYRLQNQDFSQPDISRMDVYTAGQMYNSVLAGEFSNSESAVTLTRTLVEPIVGLTENEITVNFQANQNINLDTSGIFVANDRFRVSFVSSMFASGSEFDASLIRYEDSSGQIQEIQLTDLTPRDNFLLPTADELGSWVELIKVPGQSTWNPGSPSVRIDLLDDGGLSLGIQGYLAGSQNPNDDSLSVWLEWVDAPDTITAGSEFELSYRVSYFAVIPEPTQLPLVVLFIMGVIILSRRKTGPFRRPANTS